MKIKMLVSISGPEVTFSPGDVTSSFSAAEASRLVDAGFAEKVARTPKAKTIKVEAIKVEV